jgi:ribosome-associated translation inhibitor RaiA
MRFPVQIHFLDMSPSAAVEARIRKRARGLDRYDDQIQRCDVWVESPHGHHRKGSLYAVRMRLTVPGDEIAIDSQPAEEDVSNAIRAAFDAGRRRLEDKLRRRRGRVKAHPRAERDPSRRRRIPPRAERD